jgi:hypothetical protein
MTSQRSNALNSPNSNEVKAEFRICATDQLLILRDWAESHIILSSFWRPEAPEPRNPAVLDASLYRSGSE